MLVGIGVASASLLSVGRGGEGIGHIGGHLNPLVLSTFATVCAALAARSAYGRVRQAWVIISISLGAWAAGDGGRILEEIFHQRASFVSPSTLFHLSSMVLAAAAMAQFLTGQTRRSRLRLLLDGVTAGLCLSLLVWVTALSRVYDSDQRDGAAFVVVLLFEVVDLVALTIAVLVLVRSDARDRGVLWLLVVAIGLVTFTHSGGAYLAASDHRYDGGGLAELGFAASLIAFAAAALLSRRSSPSPPPTGSVPSDSSLWLPSVPLLLAGTVGPALMMSGLERILVPLVVVTVCVRQVVAAWENRRLLAAAADQAMRDPLTGLANRTLFYDRLAHAMTRPRRSDQSVTVVSLDIDDFKLVNDSLGHPTADIILVHVGKRISACVPSGGTVARLGGDEFVVLLEGRAEHAHLVAERIVEAFGEPFVVDGESMLMRVSVGIAVASLDEPELTAEVLVNRADIAMYVAKRSRLTGAHTFSSEMTLLEPDVVDLADSVAGRAPGGAAQVRLLGELRHVIDNRGLDVVYQNKLDLRTNQIVGVEALLRWPHPQLGVLRPDTFMSLVRQHGLMRPVTDLVLERALDDAARWVSLGVGTPVAVNLFAPLLRDERLPDVLCGALQERGLASEMLTLEITEDLVLNEVGRVTSVLHRLRQYGIRVAIDDFGSGYSALSYLRDLPIDEVKLDRRFIESVTTDARAAAVVRAVIDLAGNLGVTVVAEGVEDADTAAWLRENGCDIGQGYYFGRPVAASAIPQLISG